MSIIDSIPVLILAEAKRIIEIWIKQYNLSEIENVPLTAENDQLQAYYDEELKAVYLEARFPGHRGQSLGK